ncbi:RNase adapter RapZ [Frankia sp. Cj5]|uniref:RapZ C-terminal domain-containing protein n=1 Tax=Frankia sp. Cj5 TaxID=2880978 RepID=UPI001EF6C19D|nr:RNase adapter RapZ [Frankia sp. Cj5]
MSRKILIASFGFLHGPPPDADLILDLRPYRDPHVTSHLRALTADDHQVRQAVMTTPGITKLIADTVADLRARSRTRPADPYRVAVGCAGGRHRAPTVALAIADGLVTFARPQVTHRDLRKPVVAR